VRWTGNDPRSRASTRRRRQRSVSERSPVAPLHPGVLDSEPEGLPERPDAFVELGDQTARTVPGSVDERGPDPLIAAAAADGDRGDFLAVQHERAENRPARSYCDQHPPVVDRVGQDVVIDLEEAPIENVAGVGQLVGSSRSHLHRPSPALDEADDPDVVDVAVDPTVGGHRPALDEDRNLVPAHLQGPEQITVGPPRGVEFPGTLPDQFDCDTHTSAFGSPCLRLTFGRFDRSDGRALRVGPAAGEQSALAGFMTRPGYQPTMSEADQEAGGREEIWLEKYRPQTLDEVLGHEAIVERLRSYVDNDELSHLLFAGPPGVGKTASAVAIARELYGEEWADNFLELNASDQRGIDVIRDRVKSFARTSFGGHGYRIIFLDEADALTSEAQAALRRTMEQFSNNVRFVLSCNYSSQIIDPIQSRCTVFRFSPLPDEAVEGMVRDIADNEGIEVTDDGAEALVYVAGGDMRAAINGLQAAAVTGKVVDEEAVFEITSTARPEDIEEMVTRALAGDFTAARSQLDRLLTEEGIAGGDIVDQLHRSVWEFDLDDEAAVRLLDRIGEADYRITEGANERIQLEALLASVALDD